MVICTYILYIHMFIHIHTYRLTPQRQVDHQSSQYDDDEVIYGNLQHSKFGAMGNAGSRWESYWKTTTMLRSPEHEKKEH